MKKYFIAVVLALAAATSAQADACKDKFSAYLIGGTKKVTPGVARITTQARGKTTESAFVFLAGDHYMYRPVNPDKGMWALAWKTGRYTSTNKGKTWKKVGPVNATQERANATKHVAKQAKTATNVTCAVETINGVVHDVYKADIAVTGAKLRSRHSYWVSRKIGMAVKSIYVSGAKGRESVTTQYWKPAGDATLPKPN